GDGAVVVPVMDHPAQEVGVAAGGDSLEDVPTDQVAALLQPGCGDQGATALDYVRQVVQNAGWVGGLLQGAGEQRFLPTAGIDDPADPGEIVGLRHGGTDLSAVTAHGQIEEFSLRGVRCEVLVGPLAGNTLKDRLTRSDAVVALGEHVKPQAQANPP